MADYPPAGIYLIIEFGWPEVIEPAVGQKAAFLHEVVQSRTWIREAVAASGGLGAGPSSLWIFWLENYAALERLLRDENDEVGRAYRDFFRQMPVVNEKIREEVIFLTDAGAAA